MRVADKMAFNQVNSNIRKNRNEMSELQDQAATQKRVTKPSDDPVAASRVLFSRTDVQSNDQFIKNLEFAKSHLTFTEQSLSELTELLMRAKELAISQASDASSNAQSRKITATEIKQLRDQAIQVGNRKLGDRYIFGGFKTTDLPFTPEGKYNGDGGEIKIHIDKDSFITMNLPGNKVFLGDGLSKDGDANKSIAQARSVTELEKQKVEHPDKFPTLDEEGQVREDLKAHADDVGRDNSNENAQLRGPASLRTPNAPDSVVKTPQDGGNIFSTLERMEIALNANDKAGVQESIDRIEAAMQQVVLARAQLGSKVMVIDNAMNSMHGNQVEMKSTISRLEDADVFKVVSDMNKTESTLQATLQTSGKMVQKSLLDFIN